MEKYVENTKAFLAFNGRYMLRFIITLPKRRTCNYNKTFVIRQVFKS